MGVYNRNMQKVIKDDRVATQALVHRLNRITGQLNALKYALDNGKGDCYSNMLQIKAVHAGVKRFAEAYINEYAAMCSRKESASLSLQRDVERIIRSAFTF